MISNLFPPSGGGVETFLHNICLSLPKGHTSVIAPEEEHAAEFDAVQPYAIYRVAKPKAQNYSGWYRAVNRYLSPSLARGYWYASQADSLVASSGATTVQCGALQMGVAAAIWKRRYGLPYALYVHGDELLVEGSWRSRIAGRMLTNRVLRGSSQIFSNSNYTTGLTVARGVPKSKIVKLPIGAHPVSNADIAETKDRTPLPQWRGRKVLITVSRLVDHKGHAKVLRSLPAVIEKVPDILYVIVGTGPTRPELERLADELGIHDNVSFAGYVPDDELGYYYAHSDAFILISEDRVAEGRIEGFGLVYLEANAWGLPVIGTPVGGIPDAVQDGYNGLLVDPDSVGVIAQAIVRLMRDEALARELGQNGKRLVETERNWKIAAQVVVDSLADISS